jgi:hypothetical protein
MDTADSAALTGHDEGQRRRWIAELALLITSDPRGLG